MRMRENTIWKHTGTWEGHSTIHCQSFCCIATCSVCSGFFFLVTVLAKYFIYQDHKSKVDFRAKSVLKNGWLMTKNILYCT